MAQLGQQRSPTFEALSVPAAHEHVLARLRRAIQLSEILPGERLPTERDLAESLHVSRITVREALRVLQSEGIIATRRGKGGGTVVLPGADLTIATRDSQEVISQRVRDVRELRLAIEPMAASLAAMRAEHADIRAMAEFQRGLDDSVSLPEFRRADSGFHLAIATASRNELLRQAVEEARSAMFPALDTHQFSVIHSTTSRAHLSVLEAITAGNSDLAAQRMREHIIAASLEISVNLDELDQRSSYPAVGPRPGGSLEQ